MPAREILTSTLYFAELELLSNEIHEALVIHHTAEEMNKLALTDREVFRCLNQDALFWNIHKQCLQTTLFVTLSRIFDTASGAHTIHTLINSTLANVHLFSASALRARKTYGGSLEPEWIESFMAGAWIPQEARDLRHLKSALSRPTRAFDQIYRPIRNVIFAHRLMSNMDAGATLFTATSRLELSSILDFLHDLINELKNLFSNGHKPELGKVKFADYNEQIRADARKVFKRLCH